MGQAVRAADVVSRRSWQGLAGAAGMIAAVTVLSRALGLLRWLAQAHGLGSGAIADAYNAANLLPNVLFEVAAGGALAGALIPVLAAPIARADRAEVGRITSATLGWTLLVLVPLGLLLAVAGSPVAALLGLTGVHAELVRFFLLVFGVQVPMYGLTVLLYAVLQAHHRFFWPAFAPVLSSLVVIATYLGYGALAGGEWDDPQTLGVGALPLLAWGTTAGVAAMLLSVLGPVRALGLRLRPTLRFPPGVAARVRALALAGIGAVAAQQLSVLVFMRLATSGGDDGAYTVFLYAQQVYLLPYAILVVPLATSTLPRVATRSSSGDVAGTARLVAVSTRGVLAAAGLGVAAMLAASTALATVFGVMADDRQAARQVVALMAPALAVLLPGVVGFAALFHGSRLLYGLERARDAVRVNVVGWLTVSALAVLLVVVLRPEGSRALLLSLAAASTVGMLVGGAAALVSVRSAAGPGSLNGLGRTVLVLVVGGAVGAAAGHWVTSSVLWLAGPGIWSALGAAAGGGLVALVVAGGALAGLDRGTVVDLLRLEREPSRAAG